MWRGLVVLALALALAPLAGCTAIDNFGKFQIGADGSGGGGDLAMCPKTCSGDNLVSTCADGSAPIACAARCIDAIPALGTPAHCGPVPSNFPPCASYDDITLSGSQYAINTDLGEFRIVGGGIIATGTAVLGSPPIERFCFTNFSVLNPAPIVVTGSRALAIVVATEFVYTGGFDASGQIANSNMGASGGPSGGNGGNKATDGAPSSPGGRSGGPAGGGGGGGGNLIHGAFGGNSPPTGSNRGFGGMTVSTFAGGGGGGGGGTGNGSGNTDGGGGGGGGGAVQITAGVSIKLAGVVSVAGGGGAGGSNGGGGGGGGGAGGTVWLEAPEVTTLGALCMTVVPGGGGEGGSVAGAGVSAGMRGAACPFASVGGMSVAPGGDGGDAGRPDGAPGAGMGVGAGGGAGSPGRVIVRANALDTNINMSVFPPMAMDLSGPVPTVQFMMLPP
jgi:hypothetical protein